MDFHFNVNIQEVAARFNQQKDYIAGRVRSEVEKLSISTHAFVVKYAQDKLKGWMRNHFFGPENKNVRWIPAAQNIWVVEIDESVRWIEEGRSRVFMDWLLKSPKAKTAKDGSRYLAIPMMQARGVGGKYAGQNPEFASVIKQQLKHQGISLNRIEKNEDGTPKLGVLHRLNISTPQPGSPGFFHMVTPKKLEFFSQSRSSAVAQQIGLQPHSGHFFLSKAVVTQREVELPSGKKKISKEVVTFRTISSKHEAEGRWFYPEVKPLNSIPEAYKYALAEWEKIVKTMEIEFNRIGE